MDKILPFIINILKKHPEVLNAIIVAILEELKNDPTIAMTLLGLIFKTPTPAEP